MIGCAYLEARHLVDRLFFLRSNLFGSRAFAMPPCGPALSRGRPLTPGNLAVRVLAQAPSASLQRRAASADKVMDVCPPRPPSSLRFR